MKINDEVTLEIEKLLSQGEGLAKADGFPVFVENVCPLDKVRAKIVSLNRNFARAKVLEILEPSKFRVEPFCALHNACGGCTWQFIDYDCQLAQKRLIVQETMKKIAGRDIEVREVIKSPQTREFRSKVQFPVSQTKVSKRILAGYYKKGTHELINIKACPIQPKIINKITAFIREKAQELGVSGYNEKTAKGELRHLVFRYSQEKNEILIIFVVNADKLSAKFRELSKLVMSEFAHVKGCLINYNSKKTNVILSNDTRCIAGDRYLHEKAGEIEYRISADSFFQVNLGTAKNIFDKVKEIVKNDYPNERILDAYSGVSSFGLYLAGVSKEVVSVEECKSASQDAQAGAKINNISNLTVLNGDAKEIFKKFVEEGQKFCAVLLDPPRKGCDKETLDFAARLSEKAVIYVSCSPSTLARDIKYLEEKGFEAQYIQPFDMFCHTPHIECLCLLKRVTP